MTVLFLPTAPPPAIDGTDAVYQEAHLLRSTFGGWLESLYPVRRPLSRFPRRLLGFHKLPKLRKIAANCDVIHVYSDALYAYPILNWFNKRVVLTIAGGLNGQKPPQKLSHIAQLHRVVVSNQRDAAILDKWGLDNHTIVPPGINIAGIPSTAIPLQRELTLLMASAPWVPQQFEQKGVNLLLDVLKQMPDVKLVLLWRGSLLENLQAAIASRGVGDQVDIVSQRVNISDYLKNAHAAILLAAHSGIVKAYPHSLMESLVAGKPIILSRVIPMADFVEAHGCGVVVDAMSAENLVAAIGNLRKEYPDLAKRSVNVGRERFSFDKLVDGYRRIYGLCEPN